MGYIFLILTGLKLWATDILGFNFTEVSWGWILAPAMMVVIGLK